MEFSEILLSEKENIGEAFTAFIKNKKCNYFVTLVLNVPTAKMSWARKIIKNFLAKIEAKLFGKFFYKLDKDSRLFAILFPEKINTNLHLHGFFCIEPRHEEKFNNFAKIAWNRVCPSGSIKLERLSTTENVQGASEYIRKELYKPENFENYIVSREF